MFSRLEIRISLVPLTETEIRRAMDSQDNLLPLKLSRTRHCCCGIRTGRSGICRSGVCRRCRRIQLGLRAHHHGFSRQTIGGNPAGLIICDNRAVPPHPVVVVIRSAVRRFDSRICRCRIFVVPTACGLSGRSRLPNRPDRNCSHGDGQQDCACLTFNHCEPSSSLPLQR